MKPYSRLRYYLLFLYYKLRIPLDCTRGLGRVMLSEFMHLIDAVFHLWWEMPNYQQSRSVRTIWGKFVFPGTLYCYLIVNPSTERQDMEYLLKKIKRSLARKEKVLLLDIGANVGMYSVGIPKRLGSKRIAVHAFEPEKKYFSFLTKNVKLNRIKNVHLHNVALGNKNGNSQSNEFVWPGHEVPKKKPLFRVRMLDSILSRLYVSRFDRIFVKIDIEGHEEEALRGAARFLRTKTPVFLMIEDSLKPMIKKWLTRHGFVRQGKITPHNSFWTLN